MVKDVDGIGYECLLKQLHTIDFTSSVNHDHDLIHNITGMRYDYGVTRIGNVSILEAMVCIARDTEKYMKGKNDRTAEWFWLMMKNAKLDIYTDEDYDDIAAEEVLDICDTINNHTYARNGDGGLFHTNSKKNMRRLSLWQQMLINLSESYNYDLKIEVI